MRSLGEKYDEICVVDDQLQILPAQTTCLRTPLGRNRRVWNLPAPMRAPAPGLIFAESMMRGSGLIVASGA